jgi:hypothetical protein
MIRGFPDSSHWLSAPWVANVETQRVTAEADRAEGTGPQW